MKRWMTKTCMALGMVAASIGASAPATAQNYPSQALKWIVPYPAGGGSDVTARLLASAMSKGLGQPIVIENRPGAGTQIGAQAIENAPKDGYTVGSVDSGTLAFNPSLYKKLTYNPDTSFTYIGGFARMPLALATRPDLGVNTLQEFIDLAKKHPGKLTYSSAGAGSPHHVAMEMLAQRTGMKLVHVPYKGAAPAVQDLMSGQVDAMMLDVPGGLSIMKSDKVKVLAIAMPKRVSQLPNLPTMAEAGLPDFVAFAWQGLVAPAGLAPAVVERVGAELRKALDDPQVRTQLETSGIDPMPMSAVDFTAYAKAERERWAAIIKTAGISLG